jgi:hypothetical protein
MKNVIKLGIATLALGSLAFAQTDFVAKGKATEKVQINGAIQFQSDNLSTDYKQGVADPASVNQFLLRRVYLGATGYLSGGFSGSINMDLAGGAAVLEKGVITYKNNEMFVLDFGFQKAPMAVEEQTSATKIKSVERSIVTRYFVDQLGVAGYHTGVYASGKFDGGFYYGLGLTDADYNTTAQGTSNAGTSRDNEMNWYGKIGFKGETEGFTYDVGGAYAVVNEVAAVEDIQAWELFANIGVGNFNVLVDMIKADADVTGGGDVNSFGWVIQPSYKFNDQWELVAHYANLDADAGLDIDLGTTTRRANEGAQVLFEEADQYYIGANWFINGNDVKLTFGYEIADYEGTAGAADADVDGFRARLQLLF